MLGEDNHQESGNDDLNLSSSVVPVRMETRKVRTPSARLLAAKQDEVFEKVTHTTPIAPKPMNTIAAQLAKVADAGVPIRTIVPMIPPILPQESMTPSQTHMTTRRHKEPSPNEEEVDISNTDPDMDPDDSNSKDDSNVDIGVLKTEKVDNLVMNGDFPVSNEVTISSMKYTGRGGNRKVAYMVGEGQAGSRNPSFTGETLNLKSSDLSIPNKAAHFLYFRCYDEAEVQKEFPLTIDENRKGPQNFLIEPRVGLKNTDYYIDSYLWNRGKSTSSKKKIFVEIDGNHVKTSRRSMETAHYLLNWYYSNMENRICKKVCWLETVSDGVRASPVLVQYHVNYLSDNPIELRKTPKLYSDTRSVAQELLRSDSPLQTVQRFVETGETDPREIINKKQAYEMRRYVMANARKRQNQRKREFDEPGMFFEDDMYEEVYYDEHGEPTAMPQTRARESSEAHRIAHMACRFVGRRIENRIVSLLDHRLGAPPPKNHADLLSEWINTLEGTTAEDFDISVHSVIVSMRKQLEEIIANETNDYMDEAGPSTKRRLHHHDDTLSRKQPRYEGERFIFEGHEYVEEEVITDDMNEVPSTSANEEPSNEVKFDRSEGSQFFFPAASNEAP